MMLSSAFALQQVQCVFSIHLVSIEDMPSNACPNAHTHTHTHTHLYKSASAKIVDRFDAKNQTR